MLQVSFIMICINHKTLALLKVTSVTHALLRSKIDFYFLKNN